MLSLLHPEIMLRLASIPGGLDVIPATQDDPPRLIFKVPKEYILTAKVNQGVRIYLVPVTADGTRMWALVTAFFDDEEEPLALRTPLVEREWAKTVLDVLQTPAIDVHFFDELDRELLGYRASVSIPANTAEAIATLDDGWVQDVPYAALRSLMNGVEDAFARRTPDDDAKAIDIVFERPLYDEDQFLLDARPGAHTFHGARGFSHTVLERSEPGPYQEEDIIRCLLLAFPPDQIYQGPKRTYDAEEVCDVLIVTDTRILIIQAKDSPNVARVMQQPGKRKRANTRSALNKALAQVRGALGYLRRSGPALEFDIDGRRCSIAVDGRSVQALAVVKELFNDEFGEYSAMLLATVEETGRDVVAFDYPEFYRCCRSCDSEESFFAAYDRVMGYAKETGEYPRLRFGFVGADESGGA